MPDAPITAVAILVVLGLLGFVLRAMIEEARRQTLTTALMTRQETR